MVVVTTSGGLKRETDGIPPPATPPLHHCELHHWLFWRLFEHIDRNVELFITMDTVIQRKFNTVLLYKEFSNSTLKSIKLNKHKSCSSWILNTHHHRTIGVSWRWSEHIDRNVELLHYYYGHLYSKKTKLCKRWLCIVVTRMFKFNIKASCSSWILNRPTTNWDQFHKEF